MHLNLIVQSPRATKSQAMPIADATKKQIAQKRRLFLQVCLRCGARNPLNAERCRKCKSSDLRLKNRSVGLKK